MSNLAQFASGQIKSIQRGVINVLSGNSATATITSVDTTKSLLFQLGSNGYYFNASYSAATDLYITLTNSTTITAFRGTSSSGGTTVSYQIVEYY